MHLAWSQWTLVACVAASLILLAVGALRARSAVAKTLWRTTEVRSRIAALHVESGQKYIDRINADVARMPDLIERVNVALDIMNRSMNTLKLPEAIASLRTAAAAVKLLVSGR